MGLNGIVQEGQRITLYRGEEVVSVLEHDTDVSVPLSVGIPFRNMARLQEGQLLFFPLTDGSEMLEVSSRIRERFVESDKVRYLADDGRSYTLEFEGIDMETLLAEERIRDYTEQPDRRWGVPPFPSLK